MREYVAYFRVSKALFILILVGAIVGGLVVGGIVGSMYSGYRFKYDNLVANLFEHIFILQLDAGAKATIPMLLEKGTEVRAYVAISGVTSDVDFFMTGPTGSLVFGPSRLTNEYKFVYSVSVDGDYTISVDNEFSTNAKNVYVIIYIV